MAYSSVNAMLNVSRQNNQPLWDVILQSDLLESGGDRIATSRIRCGYLPSPSSGLFCDLGSPFRYPNEARKRSISITVLV